MAERIRTYDWSHTDLGAISDWGRSLRTAVQFLLASPLPVVMLWGREGYMIYNDAYSLFAGARHPYLLGKAVEMGWPEVAEFNRNVVDTCLAGGTLTYFSEGLVLLRNGRPEDVWMDLYYSPVAGDDEAPAGVMAIVVETTAHVLSERGRQVAEQGYRAADERLQLALNAGSLLGCFVWDITGNRVSGDERFARTFSHPLELSQDGLPIEVVTEVVHPDDLERLNLLINAATQQGGPFRAEYRISRPEGGYIWVLASGRCELDEHGQPFRFPGVIVDIHEQKMAEQALIALSRTLEQRVAQEVRARSAAEDQLRQSQKLEAIGGLTGGIAHDFNNLLQVIAGNLYLLARQEANNPVVQKRVNAAITAVDRGAKLSSQLLAFARRQPLTPAVYTLPALHEGLGELLQRALGETIHLEVQMPVEPWSLRVDRNQLENAVLNLALNARDAMGGEGTIWISGENRVLDGEFCRGKELHPGDHVCLTVTDAGSGMAADVLSRAFEPFFTTKAQGHGTGLGLSMVFGFVKQSGGFIDLTSRVGQGTRVQMFFPRSHAPQAQVHAPVDEAVTGGSETLLVVEDDALVRNAAVELLQQLGYQVHEAANGDEAMALLRGGLEVDLIFTDVVMPGVIKSTDLAHWARACTPPVPVLFTSGHTRDLIAENNEWGAEILLLSKPYSPEALASRVREALTEPRQGVGST